VRRWDKRGISYMEKAIGQRNLVEVERERKEELRVERKMNLESEKEITTEKRVARE
jgi:hypothetical protein